jgi:hypothetical protein
MRHDDDTTGHAEPTFECVGCGRTTRDPDAFAWVTIGTHSSCGESHAVCVPMCSMCDDHPATLDSARREFSDMLD